MTLYENVKSVLNKDIKGVISDSEFILINRKDFHITQISSVHATLSLMGAKLGYPYRVLIAFLDNLVAGVTTKEINIILTDPSLTLAAFQCWMRAGGGTGATQLYAPRGLARIQPQKSLLGEIIDDFHELANTQPDGKPKDERLKLFTLVIGSAKASDQTLFAVDRFVEAEKGVLVLKDYARIESSDEREYLESKKVFPAMSFEGHAICFKL